MKYLTPRLLLASVITTISLSAQAEVAVVVNHDSKVRLDERDVRKVFLGKLTTLADGAEIFPVDLPVGNATREYFLNKVLHKSEASLNSHWSRMMFSSNAKPPKAVANVAAVKEEIRKNPYAIAYLDMKDVDGTVTVLFTVQ